MCGIFGLIGDQPIAESIYHGIIQLQHRGQDAAGIFTFDPITHKHAIHKNIGLVKDIFTSDTLPLPNASWGIGHVRYTTIGKGNVTDSQPLYIQGSHTIAMAHNGNIVNHPLLKRELEDKGAVFETTSDLETLLHLFASKLPDGEINFNHIKAATQHLFNKAQGAYSIVAVIAGVGLVAIRDPKGIRPLLMGSQREHASFAFASENNALHVFGFEQIHDVKPGEVVFIDHKTQVHKEVLTNNQPALCSFEHDYFSKPNTVIDNREVYQSRRNLGKTLGRQIKQANIDIDVVTAVPSSARAAAIALAKELGVDYEEGFVKQDHIGRTFIMPTHGIRQKALSRKLAPVHSVFKGKNVLLVDDSIVRGTVSKRVVSLARWAGANQVYFASTYPPIRHPCLYGIDFPNPEQLIATNRTVEAVADEIHANRLFYNSEDDLHKAIGTNNLCTACLTGKYPTTIDGKDELQQLRHSDLQSIEGSYVKH